MHGLWGNPSSIHAEGRAARAAVENARQEVAALLSADSEEIVFTSGGTEGDNLALSGLAALGSASGAARAHLVSSPLEHPAVVAAALGLAAAGHAVTWLQPDAAGEIDAEALEAALAAAPAPLVVSLALANHEIGNCFPVASWSARVRARGGLFHTDAVQAVGKIPVSVKELGVDALTVSAHKIGGPKGMGALWIRRGIDLPALVRGGHQERERRGGTENLLGIVGFGAACRAARQRAQQSPAALRALRDRLEEKLLAIPGARRHGGESRVPGTTNLGFAGAPGELVAIGLDLEGISVSTGAACTSGSLEPSPVLLALGLSRQAAREGVRFSLGPETRPEDIDRAATVTAEVVARVRRAN